MTVNSSTRTNAMAMSVIDIVIYKYNIMPYGHKGTAGFILHIHTLSKLNTVYLVYASWCYNQCKIAFSKLVFVTQFIHVHELRPAVFVTCA